MLVRSLFLQGILFAAAASGADSPKTALDYVPENCETFAMIAGVRDRIEWVSKTGVVQNLFSLKEVRELVDTAMRDNDLKKAVEVLNSPLAVEARSLLSDLGSDEVSLTLGPGWAKLQSDFDEITWQMRISTVMAATTGKAPNMADIAFDVVARYPDMQVPALVFSFKADVGDRVEKHLADLQRLMQEKKIPGKVEVGKPGDAIRWAWRVDGKDLQLKRESLGDLSKDENAPPRPESIDGIVKWIEGRKLVVAVAHIDGRWILSIGADDSLLKQWGKAPSLGASKWFAPVRALGRKDPIRAATYSSIEEAKLGRYDLDNIVSRIRPFTLIARPFAPPGLVDRIMSDLGELAKDVDAAQAPASETVEVEYAVGDMLESFNYTHAAGVGVDYDRPIRMLAYIPVDSAIAYAHSGKSSIPTWRRCVFWVKRLHAYWREFGRKLIDADDRDKADEIEKLAVSTGKKLNTIFEEKILPSLDACQTLWLVDLKNRREIPGMKGEKTVMPEIALAMTIRDGKRLVAGVRELKDLLHSTLASLKGIDENIPASIVDFRIPEPSVQQAHGGVRYIYPVANDASISPDVLLTNDLLVLSSSKAQTDRMLAPHAVVDPYKMWAFEPSGSVFVLNFRPFVVAASDWCRLAAKSDKDMASVATVGPAVLQVFGLLKQTAIRSARKGDLIETQTVVRFRKLNDGN